MATSDRATQQELYEKYAPMIYRRCLRFLRSKEDPVKVIETLGKRIHGVHLKDVKDATTFTILGQGDMNVVAVLKALKALKYDQVLALEYEEHPENPIPDVQECLATLRRAVEQI